ncbi:MAG: hypothetical protein U1C33_08695, partial [Candidatus Cloacimonadaceae bacterium]|nr:hypothetical protein [Candidatus Cloacimonadaceae bacterium]
METRIITRQRVGLFLCSLIAIVVLTGCTNPFRPKLRDDSRVSTSNRTPLDVLQNLELAYRQKNINLYKELLHPDFRFELI